ncbi:ammonium transporter [Clostridium sp. HCP1S3_B4]|uniref:ammonium transporter n=1 Tax=unclassified Clostridium TaxID=2614128 RepID=UPI00168FE265|nr:ammonium transporter [Clostridiales bacterium]MDY2730077.1 ammonium transporter [Clostridium sp.]NLK22831.1 ammonium transporter [Clostridiales bacterium]
MENINFGDCGFIMICAALVFIMTPALAFFYGGMVRRKNVLNTILSSFFICGLASVLWIIIGYSLSFGSDHGGIIGNLSHLFFNGVSNAPNDTYASTIPETLFATFQMMFALITCALITGSLIGRMKFKSLFIFIAVWSLLVYYPLAHMVWGDGGLLKTLGAIDFAGGNVVHISSGVSGLVACILLGKRRCYGMVSYKPHNIPFVFLGAALLWFGWFGFNAGSALGANSLAVHAFLTTNTSAAAALLSWMAIEWIKHGKPTLLGAATGAVVGLVAITPGAGFVPIWSALIIGAFVSPICYFFMGTVKKKFGYDDALDAFGCHGIGGIYGGIMTGIFASQSVNGDIMCNGLIYGDIKLFLVQILSIVVTIAIAAIMTFIIIKVIKLFMDIRVSDAAEANGLDISEHNESAYPSFMGLD